MGKTEFYQQATDLQTNFKWSEIFSDMTKPRTDAQKDNLLAAGCKTYMPSEANMLREWQKPFLFYRFGVVGLIFLAVLLLCMRWVKAYSFFPLLMFVPAFIVPLTVLIFIWEMNVPRNISILDVMKYMMYSGLLSTLVTFFVRDILMMSADAEAYIAGPFPEEVAKFLMVYFIIKKLDCKYVLNGLLVGCAVGVGFSAQESAGYAFTAFIETYTFGLVNGSGEYNSMLLGLEAMQNVNLTRALFCWGGHIAWAALYGAALVHEKKQEPLKMAHAATPSVLMALITATGLHFVWNFPIEDFFEQQLMIYVKYIVLSIVVWMIMFKWMRTGLIQVIEIGTHSGVRNNVYVPIQQANTASGRLYIHCVRGALSGKKYEANLTGGTLIGRDPQAAIMYPKGVKGISGKHCEIKVKGGKPVLIDRGSTYGTFLADGKKLEPNVPYEIKNGMVFYLASKENKFEIKM